MKKILVFILLAGLAFGTNSCKKEKCPEPQYRGMGTWKLSKYISDGVEQSLNTDEGRCLAQSTIILNNSFDGISVDFYSYDNNNNTCESDSEPVISWFEDIPNDFLYVSTQDYTYKFDILNDHTIKWVFIAAVSGGNGEYSVEFTKQD